MQGSFLQTPEWLAFQESLGRKTWRLDDGVMKAGVIRHTVRFGQNFLYIPRGPEADFASAKNGLRNEIKRFSDALRGIAREERSMFLKIEPVQDQIVELLYRSGVKLRESSVQIQPSHTTILDLTKESDDLLDHLHHKHRYNINLAERKGVTVEESRDANIFWKLLEITARRDAFRSHPMLYYKKLLNFFSDPNGALRVRLYLAHYGGAPIAGVFILEYGQTAYYLHGASDHSYRALMGPHLLHWTLIQKYKAEGFTAYDFWGIDAKKWPGVTRFKLGFGGAVVEYPGSFDIVFRHFWHWLYTRAPR